MAPALLALACAPTPPPTALEGARALEGPELGGQTLSLRQQPNPGPAAQVAMGGVTLDLAPGQGALALDWRSPGGAVWALRCEDRLGEVSPDHPAAPLDPTLRLTCALDDGGEPWRMDLAAQGRDPARGELLRPPAPGFAVEERPPEAWLPGLAGPATWVFLEDGRAVAALDTSGAGTLRLHPELSEPEAVGAAARALLAWDDPR